MVNIQICNDLTKARRIWEGHWPRHCLFDLWDVRACFQEPYQRPLHFVVATENNQLRGLLALSWIEEISGFGHFPGEIWNGKTWLEQNKIIADTPEVFERMFAHIPGEAHIRYLTADSLTWATPPMVEDETGFLFFPSHYGYSFDAYLQGFSGKSRKKLRSEINRLEALGVTYRYDCQADMKPLLELNLANFGRRSYFSEARFFKSFENLVTRLSALNLLRMTTVLIGGRVAAVDMGAIWNNTYTVLAGGTDVEFPGVAKLINLHHIQWACRQRLACVDFLCGDFNWKSRFHLVPRPLYELCKTETAARLHETPVPQEAVLAG